MSDFQIKGQAFRSFVAVLEELHGADAVARTMAELPAEIRDAFEYKSIVASGWYSGAWYRELHEAARRALPHEAGLARAIGYEGTRSDLAGIYAFVLRVLVSPAMLLKQVPRIFGIYNRGGRARVLYVSRGRATIRYESCPRAGRLMWQDTAGSAEAALEASGAKHVRTHVVAGGDDDDDFAEFEILWT